jgi:hypothetical protein
MEQIQYVVENIDVKSVGDWLYGLLSLKELMRIFKHKQNVIEPDIVIRIELTLSELESLYLYGHLPPQRNCFEINGFREK